MNRLPPTITIVLDRDAQPDPQRYEASMARYRTIMFGIEIMRAYITRSYAVAGQVDASLWWGMVPECYREPVARCMERVLAKYRGIKLDQSGIELFVRALNVEIWQHIEPVMPGGEA